MDRSEVIDYLHDVGYSRRMSCKLADIALLVKSEKPFEVALRNALEKARKPGAKDKKKRKRYKPYTPPIRDAKTLAGKFTWARSREDE